MNNRKKYIQHDNIKIDIKFFKEECEQLSLFNRNRYKRSWALRLAQKLAYIMDGARQIQKQQIEKDVLETIADFAKRGGDPKILLEAANRSDYAQLWEIAESVGVLSQITKFMTIKPVSASAPKFIL